MFCKRLKFNKKWEENERKMLGRIIYFLIILTFIFIVNAHDFDNLLNHGVNDYIQRYPGVLYTGCALITVPMLVFDLRGEGMYIAIVILEAVYVTIYTVAYFRIQKKKKEEEKIQYERKNNKK